MAGGEIQVAYLRAAAVLADEPALLHEALYRLTYRCSAGIVLGRHLSLQKVCVRFAPHLNDVFFDIFVDYCG